MSVHDHRPVLGGRRHYVPRDADDSYDQLWKGLRMYNRPLPVVAMMSVPGSTGAAKMDTDISPDFPVLILPGAHRTLQQVLSGQAEANVMPGQGKRPRLDGATGPNKRDKTMAPGEGKNPWASLETTEGAEPGSGGAAGGAGQAEAVPEQLSAWELMDPRKPPLIGRLSAVGKVVHWGTDNVSNSIPLRMTFRISKWQQKLRRY
jgi:hypothetical protein